MAGVKYDDIYNIEEIKELSKNSLNISDMCNKLKVSKNNTRFRKWLRNLAEKEKFALPCGQREIRNKKMSDPKNFFKIYENGTQPIGKIIDSYLQKLGVEKKCRCGVTDMYNNRPINLEVDHINGKNYDNRLENLRYLCPNCHSQTDTFRARSSNQYKDVEPTICENCNDVSLFGQYCRGCCKLLGLDLKEMKICGHDPCDRKIEKTSTWCREHSYIYMKKANGNKTKANYPSLDQLKREITETSYEAVGRKYGVTGNAVRKYIKNSSRIKRD